MNILTERRYQYCKFDPMTGTASRGSVEQVFVEGDEVRVPAQYNYKFAPVETEEKIQVNLNEDPISDDEVYEELQEPVPVRHLVVPARVVPARPVAPEPVAPARELLECNVDEQFWNIISQIGWRSPTEGLPTNPRLLSQLNNQGKINFRRIYEEKIEILRQHTDRIALNEQKSISLASHFVGLGLGTFDGVREDPTFIMLLYEENMYGNFDAIVLAGLI